MEPLEAARAVVGDRFPDARWALLTGSVLGPHRTAGSDLDIVVMRDDGPGFRESLVFEGWPVELFVHTPERLAGILERERAARKPSTHRMLAHGVPLAGDPGELRERCARVLAEGPPPLSPAELAWLRYSLTDALDDLRHATDPGERAAIAADLWPASARAALSVAGRWLGSGKWLWRELHDLDPALAGRWLAVRADPGPFAQEVLSRAGGPLFDGYRA
ncbi:MULTISPECIES: nucleotidyltransferase domain-containing protein [Actinoplanes]|uniref:nucleotidyltransferase domain-containing protein n=1 Tax=Actinoplanes TaxID=1865 RepID=UPI0005F2E7E1|nr:MULTISPECIES: nucleotidyltransferase domain-containing protein [Actinoplanes]GLY06283.1 nucleotidyltransferase [Actinoplanes sp. NBRC 101535]